MAPRAIAQIEIPAADRDKSATFYKEVFDWDYQHQPEDYHYTLLTLGGGIPLSGGLTDMAKPGEVIFYLQSDDLEADLARIEAAGGQRTGNIDVVPGAGSLAYFIDPNGNRIGLWKIDPAFGMGGQ